MAATNKHPPLTNPKDQFFLLAIPYDRGQLPTQRLRFHSSENPIIVLTDDAPKFIRFHSQASIDGTIYDDILVATSWDTRHKDRWWGVSLNRTDSLDASLRELKEVHILEGKLSSGFKWVATPEGDSDELVYVEPAISDNTSIWARWMVCEGSLGMKQLFWTTSSYKEDLPAHGEHVRIIRERVWGQPYTPNPPNERLS